MKTNYDLRADAFYLRFAPDEVAIRETREVAPGVMLDVDESGDMIGIEVTSVSRRMQTRLADAA